MSKESAIGEMNQFGGSSNGWFEGRAEVSGLLHAVYDASGRVFLRFVPKILNIN